MRNLIESYAWIEYLEGSYQGEKVHEILSGSDEIFVLTLIIGEVVSKVKRKGMDAELAFNAISKNSKIFEISADIARDAGLLHAERRKKVKDFGLMDALILIAARKLKANILTSDSHFKDFKETVLLN